MSLLQRRAAQFAFGLQMFAFSTAAALAGAPTPLGQLPGIAGPEATDSEGVRRSVVAVLNFVLNFLALLAVIFIVIAGIRLIVSQGEQEQKDKARKTIIYVLIGLIVVLFAKVLVGFVTSTASSGFTAIG